MSVEIGGLKFKWQWAVFYEKRMWSLAEKDWAWSTFREDCSSRRLARNFKRVVNHPGDTSLRNGVMKRRLVQRDWTEYKDSFTWNAGVPNITAQHMRIGTFR